MTPVVEIGNGGISTYAHLCARHQSDRRVAGWWVKPLGNEKKWEAFVTADRKRHFLGRFVSIEDAIRVRDAAVLGLHGDFAVLNGPRTMDAQP